MKRLLFIDRDGTIIKEPADEQIDSFEKLEFVEGAITNLSFIRKKLDFEFVMVSNQDGLGTASFPEDTFWPVHNFILKTLHGEGIDFDDMLIDRHFPEDNHPDRQLRQPLRVVQQRQELLNIRNRRWCHDNDIRAGHLHRRDGIVPHRPVVGAQTALAENRGQHHDIGGIQRQRRLTARPLYAFENLNGTPQQRKTSYKI